MHNEPSNRTTLTALRRVVWWFVVAVSTLTIMGFLARFWWAFEYACHFRLQYSYVLAAATLLLAAAGRHGQAIGAGGFLLLNLATIVPFYLRPAESEAVGPTLRLLSANVGVANRQPERIIELVAREQPDFVLLLEANENWAAVVERLRADYPYAVLEMQSGNFSSVLLSRFRLTETKRKRFAQISIFALVAECEVHGQRMKLIASHLLPPYIKGYFDLRNEHLLDLAAEAAESKGPVVLIGDLNVTPWSPHFQTLRRQSGLVDSRLGFGVRPTWPALLPGLRIPIDHCLVSPDITVHDWRRGPLVGSDHLPILIELTLPHP